MNKICFSVREYPELLALDTIIKCYENSGNVGVVDWYIVCSPINTDFNFLSIAEACAKNNIKVSIVDIEYAVINKWLILGFKTDKSHYNDMYVYYFFDIFNIVACRMFERDNLKVWRKQEVLVVGNIKIKSPIEEFQMTIFNRLAKLPCQVKIVPRHPMTKYELRNISVPKKIQFVNTMGDLESLHSQADVVVMGRVFCPGDLISHDDHNPFEATINANALAGVNTNIPSAYQWIYNDSGLIHQCTSYDEVFELIPFVLNDSSILHKLNMRKEHILENRKLLIRQLKDLI